MTPTDESEAGGSTEHRRIADAEADGGIGSESQGVGLGADDTPRALLKGGPGSDFVLGDSEAFGGSAIGAGNDEITGGSVTDGLVGDNLSAGPVTDAGDDAIQGDDGDDDLFGDNINVARTATLGTVGGDDRLEGDMGDDTLFAGPANDSLNGGPNTDSCDGEDGTDTFARCETVTGSP